MEAENLDAEMFLRIPITSRCNNPKDRQSLRALRNADYYCDKKRKETFQDVSGNGLQEQGGLGKEEGKEIYQKESGREESFFEETTEKGRVEIKNAYILFKK